MSSAAYLSAEKIVAVGYGGCVVKSEDGGETWKKINVFSRADFLSLTFSDEKNGSMTDANGMVWLTGDGGNTWLPFNVRTNPKLVSMYFADQFTGWAVGENGLIIRTDDGGYSWQRLSEGGREDVNDLTFFDEDIGVSVGSHGKSWITNNGGKNWLPVYSGVEENLNALSFIDARTRSGRSAIKARFCAPSTAARVGEKAFQMSRKILLGVYFVNEKTGFAVGANGMILRSDTSGAYWEHDRIGNASLARRRKIY